MVVRAAKVSDAKDIAQVHVETWQVAYRGQVPDHVLDGLSVEKRVETWRKTLLEKREHTFVAEVDHRVVGFSYADTTRDEDKDPLVVGEIYSIYLLEEFWGEEMGAQLFEYALSNLNERGFGEVMLWVLDGNKRARKFYEKMGFVADGAKKIEEREGYVLNEVRYHRLLK